MRKSDSLLLMVLVLGSGCAPRTEAVSVDVDRIPLEGTFRLIEPATLGSTPDFGTSLSIPDVPARNVFLGSGAEQARAAVDAAKRNQERAYREALDLFRELKNKEASAEIDQEAEKLRLAYEDRFKAVYAELRILFDKHADQLGPLWTRLAVLNGFPEKRVARRPPPEADIVGRAEYKEAAEIRVKIADLNADYRQEVSKRLEALKQAFRADQTELAAKRIVRMDQAEAEAEAEAQRTISEMIKGLEDSLIQDIERLPAVKGTSVKVPGAAPPRVVLPMDDGPPWSERERIRRRAELFAKMNGYRLVPAAPGVRDATQEFMAWDSGKGGR
jgi:hypothetical protein